MKNKIRMIFLIIFIIVPCVVWIYEKFRPIPENLSYKGETHKSNFKFIKDLTYISNTGEKVVEQEIFEEMFKEIDEAEEFVLVDLFLYNDDYDKSSGNKLPKLSESLTNKLLDKKKSNPNISMVVITDPINTFYGSYLPEQLKELKNAGVQVVITDLSEVKDSNPIYSNFYRAYLQWIPKTDQGSLPNIFDSTKPKTKFTSYLDLLNFKANHRKVLATEKNAIIASSNPHDGSFYHSNIGFKVSGDIINDIIKSERAVLRISKEDTTTISKFKAKNNIDGKSEIKLLTEGKINEELLKNINESEKGENLKIGVFYLSSRDIVDALKNAGDRGVNISIILDLNKDAFGKKKIGIPNKQVAKELVEHNVQIRWYETQGEQFHSKMLIRENKNEVTIVGGSANFTRRNLNDLNLETDLSIKGKKEDLEIQKVLEYYNRIWNNEGGTYTSEYEKYAEDKIYKDVIYWIQEVTGLSTF